MDAVSVKTGTYAMLVEGTEKVVHVLIVDTELAADVMLEGPREAA